jgi:iron complex outermembrane receptor protein
MTAFKVKSIVVSLMVSACAPVNSFAQAPPPPDLTQVSLENLMNVQVTSVSKKEQKLFTTGAAVFVISQEDIRRSGVTNIPDALRMAPGVNVARLNANSWAISVRGFNDLYADKVLVLIDGRSVFDPLFSGVYWGDLDIPLEDIERIEVIRGPGGTVWGANAVNGVINIITKSSRDTQGGLLRTDAALNSDGGTLAQYGGAGATGSYRFYGQYFNVDTFKLPSGLEALDGVHSFREGFRADLRLTPHDTLMIEADVKNTEQGDQISAVLASSLPNQTALDDVAHNMAADALMLWNHQTERGDEISLQVFDNRSTRSQLGQRFVENTFDLDFSDHMAVGSRQDVVWGAGLRMNELRAQPGYAISFLPENRTDALTSAFVQDQIRLTDSLSLTLGSKFEHNSYTGFETEPSAQLVWTPNQRQTVWISAARAVRQPNMVDTQIVGDLAILPATGFPFALFQLQGNPKPLDESNLDYEAGYRIQVGSKLSIDTAGFVSLFRDVRSVEAVTPYVVSTPAFSYLVLPVTYFFNGQVRTDGGEIFATWNATSKWRLSPGYSLFRQSTAPDPSNIFLTLEQTGRSSPRSSFEMRSFITLPHNFEWDSTVSYTSSIIGGLAGGAIPSYTQLNSRFGWRNQNLELSLVGQDLLRAFHQEFPDELGINHSMIPRSVFLRIAWSFHGRK